MESNSEFAYKMLIFSLVIMLTLPLMINVFIPSMDTEDSDAILEDYYRFTGASGATSEAVWVLTGIYTPYEGDTYNYTPDGWLYGSRISQYTPSQYEGSLTEFTVYRDSNGIYRYLYNSADYDERTGIGHKGMYETESSTEEQGLGDIYTAVVFEADEKSDIFFSSSGKHNASGETIDRFDSSPFYYDFTGYRYAFQPTANYTTVDADGREREVVATTTSLSLIWYYYYTANGIAGQLVLSGSDYGVAYLSGDQIVKAFDSTTSTAKFSMVFNGVDMGVYIRLDPSVLSSGTTVKDAYDNGYWSIMITSITTDLDAYMGTDYDLNIENLFDTLIDLMTFDYTDYGMSAFMGTLCSFIIVIPLYAGLIALALSSWQAMAAVAMVAVVQGIASAIKNFGNWNLFGVVQPNLSDVIQALMTIIGMG